MNEKKSSFICLFTVLVLIVFSTIMFCFISSFAEEAANVDTDVSQQNSIVEEKATPTQETSAKNTETGKSSDVEKPSKDADTDNQAEKQLETKTSENAPLLQDSAVPNATLPSGISVLKNGVNASQGTDYEYDSTTTKLTIKTDDLTVSQTSGELSMVIEVLNNVNNLTLNNVNLRVSGSINADNLSLLNRNKDSSFKLNIIGNCTLKTVYGNNVIKYLPNESPIGMSNFELTGQAGSQLNLQSAQDSILLGYCNFVVSGSLLLNVQSSCAALSSYVSGDSKPMNVRFSSNSKIVLKTTSAGSAIDAKNISSSVKLERGKLYLASPSSSAPNGVYMCASPLVLPDGCIALGSTSYAVPEAECTNLVQFKLNDSLYFAKIGDELALTLYADAGTGGQGGQGGASGASDASDASASAASASGLSQTGDNNMAKVLSLIALIIASGTVALGSYSRKNK